MRVHERFNPHYMAVLLCFRCGSNRVDVKEWANGTTAVIRCSACDHEAQVAGFTVGRVTGPKAAAAIVDAVKDQAQPEPIVEVHRRAS